MAKLWWKFFGKNQKLWLTQFLVKNILVKYYLWSKTFCWSKITFFGKNRNFIQNSKCWSKIEILFKNQNVGQKSKFWRNFRPKLWWLRYFTTLKKGRNSRFHDQNSRDSWIKGEIDKLNAQIKRHQQDLQREQVDIERIRKENSDRNNAISKCRAEVNIMTPFFVEGSENLAP